MKPKTYFGWTNYETWCVALWLDNDSWTYSHLRQEALKCWKHALNGSRLQDMGISPTNDAILNLSEVIKAEVNESLPVITGLYADLLGSAISEVDWCEIATHNLDDVRDETEVRQVEQEFQYTELCKQTDEAIAKMEAAQNADCIDE